MRGSPMNIIQGTKTSVRMHVRWYKGSMDNGFPNSQRNTVMDG